MTISAAQNDNYTRNDLYFITVKVIDKNKINVLEVDNLIKLQIECEGTLAWFDNGILL